MSFYAMSFNNGERAISTTWEECQDILKGKTKIQMKKFTSLDDAQRYLQGDCAKDHDIAIHQAGSFTASTKLTEEQHTIFEFFQRNSTSSLLITGPAGTGKSFLVGEIVRYLKHYNIPHGVTGSTGNAAVLIKGRTLHSFLGIGLGKRKAVELVEDMAITCKRGLKKVHTIILDEVSMISAELLDKVSEVLKLVRSTIKPFGGIRMIFIGDACQLPPVEGSFFFKSSEWEELKPTIFHLNELIRQGGDHLLQSMLKRLRWGECTKDDYKVLKACAEKDWGDTLVRPTRLYATHKDVEIENEQALNELLSTGSRKVGSYKTEYKGSPTQLNKMKFWCKSSRIPESILLCDGLQVMVTWNFDTSNGIVNGTRGVIVDLTDDIVHIELVNKSRVAIPFVSVEYDDDTRNNNANVRFMPLRLAYALTIHKCQGVTLDCAEMDLGRSIFEYGQAYTALSRVKNLDSVKITALKRSSFRTHPQVIEFYQNIDKIMEQGSH